MQISYVILDMAKPHTENIKGLNLAAVIYTTTAIVGSNPT
jgi:hypothetical protein